MTAPRFFRLGLFHVCLLLLSAAFLFPFVWMLLVASKTDEEVVADRLPALPTFRATSPYLTSDGKTAALELLGVEMRTHELRIFKVVTKANIVSIADTSDPRAKIVPSESGARIEYDFSRSRDPIDIVLRFPMPVDEKGKSIVFDEIHKLAVAIRPDDSWHRIEASLEVESTRWESTRANYLAQNRATTLLYQPPSDDDQSLKSKTWTVLSATPMSEASRGATLHLRIVPSGTLQAMWGKLSRNYDRVFRSVPFVKYVRNSVILVVLSVAGMLFSSTFVAYAFARLNWPGRSVAMGILLSTMMLPPQVTMVPSFVVIKSLGWYNTLNPMWVPSWLGSAFFIFLMVQHLRTIPRELEEAARIDGLGYVQTWYYIILPQVKPAAAAVAILTFQAAWNDFLGPLLYVRDQSLFPLSLGLYDLQLYSANDQSVIMAGNVLMTLPVVIIFFLFQRYFVAGVTMSGLKG